MTKIFDMTGKKAVVTGAASGIGAETVRLLRLQGAEVIGIDRTPDIRADQQIMLDMADASQIDAALSQIGGGIDVLCNIAGVSGRAPAQQVLDVNFLGLRYLTEALLPSMNRDASIVNLASGAGKNWNLHLLQIKEVLLLQDQQLARDQIARYLTHQFDAYSFSKELLIAWTAARGISMKRENGVRMNAVSPGPVATPLLAEFKQTLGEERVNQAIAEGGQAGTPTDVAAVVTFLASPASAWLCGENLFADGGVITARTMSGLLSAD